MRSVLFALALLLKLGGQEVRLPDLQGLPTAPAPHELGNITLPDTVSAVTALFQRLPSGVAAHLRSPQFDRISPERATVGYGEDLRISGVRGSLLFLQAIDSSKEGFFPANWTGGHVVAFMASRGNETKAAGRDGNLLWLHRETVLEAAGSPERFPVYGTLWGKIDSPWIFSVQANTPENRDALVAAFVAAARSSPR